MASATPRLRNVVAKRARVASGRVEVDEIALAIDGASPAYIKELLRRATVLSVVEDGSIRVTQSLLRQAHEELSSSGLLGQRMLGFQSDDDIADHLPPVPGFPMGLFPAP